MKYNQDYTVSTVFALNSRVKCKPGNIKMFPALDTRPHMSQFHENNHKLAPKLSP